MFEADDELLRPTALMTAQVRNVFAGLEAAGFVTQRSESGAWAAARRADRGLVRVDRYVAPASLLLTFAGWPPRSGTLAELRAWLSTFPGVSG